MSKIYLFPLDAELARRLAGQRGVSVPVFLSNLLREDAALTLLGLRGNLDPVSTEAARHDLAPTA